MPGFVCRAIFSANSPRSNGRLPGRGASSLKAAERITSGAKRSSAAVKLSLSSSQSSC